MPSPLRPGHLLAAFGAALLGAALWLPWYAVDLSGTLGRELGDPSQTPTLLAEILREVAATVPADLTVTAWQAFGGADVLLAVACALVLFAVVSQSSGLHDAAASARLALVVGCAATGLVALKLASPPGPAGMLEVRYGAWAALCGALLVAAGGVLAARAPGASPPAVPPVVPPAGDAPLQWETAGSVAPPGR
jgi:hypothetical protein